MYEAIILCVLGLVITEIYSRTKHPKLYAFLNIIAGSGSLVILQALTAGFPITVYNSAFSAILGVPGTVLIYIMNVSGVI